MKRFKKKVLDPITAGFTAVSDISKLVTEALPGDEQQLEKFRLRSPKIYARIMQNLYNTNKRFLRWNNDVDIDGRVDLINGDLPEKARALMKSQLHADLKR